MQILRKSDSNLKMLFVKESDTDIKDLHLQNKCLLCSSRFIEPHPSTYSTCIDQLNVFNSSHNALNVDYTHTNTHTLKHNDRWDLTVHFGCRARWG